MCILNRKYETTFAISNKYFIDVAENETSGVDLFLYTSETGDFKLNCKHFDEDILNCYEAILQYIKENYEKMAKAYYRHPFIINKGYSYGGELTEKTLGSKLIPVYKGMSNDLNISVSEFTRESDRTFRNYFIEDPEHKIRYLADSLVSAPGEFEPMAQVVSQQSTNWKENFYTNVVNAVRKELQGIKETIEEVGFDEISYTAYSYIDQTYSIQTTVGEEMQFEKYNNYKEMYYALADKIEQSLNGAGQYQTSPKGMIRFHINNCRRYLADAKDMLFVAEMGTIKGLLISICGGTEAIDLQQTIPQEKCFDSFSKKYKTITGIEFL